MPQSAKATRDQEQLKTTYWFTAYFMGIPSADKLRAKSENAAGLCAGQGIGNFLHYKVLKGWGLEAKKIPARSVFGFVRERPRAPGSISADLIFGYFVSRQKVTAPAAIERGEH